MISGELSAMTRGAQQMPHWSASSWDMLILQVSANPNCTWFSSENLTGEFCTNIACFTPNVPREVY